MTKNTIGSTKLAKDILKLYDKTGGYLMTKAANKKVKSVPFLKVR